MKTNFEAYKDKIGEWRWRAKRGGRIVADAGEGYKRLPSMLRSFQRFCESLTSPTGPCVICVQEVKKCTECNGAGSSQEGGTFSRRTKCDVCKGTGTEVIKNHPVHVRR